MIDAGEFDQPGRVLNVNVVHAEWCGFHRGDLCDCEPEISKQVIE